MIKARIAARRDLAGAAAADRQMTDGRQRAGGRSVGGFPRLPCSIHRLEAGALFATGWKPIPQNCHSDSVFEPAPKQQQRCRQTDRHAQRVRLQRTGLQQAQAGCQMPRGTAVTNQIRSRRCRNVSVANKNSSEPPGSVADEHDSRTTHPRSISLFQRVNRWPTQRRSSSGSVLRGLAVAQPRPSRMPAMATAAETYINQTPPPP